MTLLDIAGAGFWGDPDWRLVTLLLDRGADVRGDAGWHVLRSAVAAKPPQTAVAESIFQRGFDPNREYDVRMNTRRGVLPLQNAIFAGNVRLIELLIRHGAKIDAVVFPWKNFDLGGKIYGEGIGLGFAWPQRNEAAAFRVLLEHGLPINVCEQGEQQTLLHRAVAANDLDFVDYLLARRIDESVRDRKGRTALEFAREQKLAPIAARLEASRTNDLK